MRIASLFPSATELVAGIGATDQLVGRSHQCNYPPGISDVPVVTESTFDTGSIESARDIDRMVTAHHHGDSTYFHVHSHALRAVKPEVLITQSLCDVCAIPKTMTRDAMAALDTEPELVTIDPMTVDDILGAVDKLGEVVGRESDAAELKQLLENRITAVCNQCLPDASRQRVVCLEWTDALRCHGLWIPDIIEMLGATDGFGVPGEHGHVIEWDDLVALDPDVLIVSPCGRSIPEIKRDMATVMDRAGWSDLSAVKDNRVFFVDGELTSRHGPRIIRVLEVFAKILYPDRFLSVSWSRDEVVQLESPSSNAD